ncbi:acid ceramidase-like isoform X2 [Lycorma delicatula]
MGCANNTYPPDLQQHIPTYELDLDKPPEERWVQLVNDKNAELLALYQMLKNNTYQLFGVNILEYVDLLMPFVTKTLPKEYYKELIGISSATGITVGEVTLYNIFYELFSACTSVVMQSNDKRMYLGRNLDFGLFLGWDVQNKTWIAPEFLRPLIVKIEFKKQNKTLYKSVSFAGYIGILTAIKKDAFALTVNERFKFNGGYVGLIEWILGRRDQKWMGLLTREVMETANSYTQAQKALFAPDLIAPVYFILAGRKSHQGCVITRGRHDADLWSLENYVVNDNIDNVDSSNTSKWFLVQTNYDHWKKPPFYDNRVDPANQCMKQFGSKHAEDTLYKVLSTRPVLNKLTTYTAIMDVTSGDLHSWIQDCEDPCWPW